METAKISTVDFRRPLEQPGQVVRVAFPLDQNRALVVGPTVDAKRLPGDAYGHSLLEQVGKRDERTVRSTLHDETVGIGNRLESARTRRDRAVAPAGCRPSGSPVGPDAVGQGKRPGGRLVEPCPLATFEVLALFLEELRPHRDVRVE